jgi:hypothetical protein
LYLVYGTGHEKGVEVMKAAMRDVDGNDGMSFKDPRTRGAPLPGQMTLWHSAEVPQPELLELVRLRLQAGPASLAQLGHRLLPETARWRAQDARKAVQDLLKEGAASVNPAGRIIGTSVVTLR